MFSFLTRKSPPKQIGNFNEATQAITFYIEKKDWEKAKELILTTKRKEKEFADIALHHLEEGGKGRMTKEYVLKKLNKNLEEIKYLESLLIQDESRNKFIPEAIKRYEDAVKSTKTLILLQEWKKAKDVIREVKEVEKKSLERLLVRLESEGDTIYAENEKKKQVQIYNKKEVQLEKILSQVIVLETKYNEKQSNQKFKIRFKKVKSEIEFLCKTSKSQDAMALLKDFLEENKENSSVINFYNTEKQKILKSIEQQKRKEEAKIKKNLKMEAMKLAGQTIKISEEDEEAEKKLSFMEKLKKKFDIYKNLQARIRRKRLLDEVQILMQENENVNKDIVKRKMENIHKGLIKDITGGNMNGYDLYGKILAADKISGDTFGINEGKNKYNFFLGDATGHGIKAGLIVTLLTRLFTQHISKSIQEMMFQINNGLKQDLKSRNFITGILFEVEKENIDTIKYVGFGHEPMLVYRSNSDTIERIIPGGLAVGIRMIKDEASVKSKEIVLSDNDTILTYSDGVTEAKGENGDFFGLDNLSKVFKEIAHTGCSSSKMYKHIIESLIAFRGGTAFDDDVTVMVIKRDITKDIQQKDSLYIKSLAQKENLNKTQMKKLIGKSKEEIMLELKNFKKEKELKTIIVNLEKLYQIGEFLKLKQEAIRYIKEGWIDKKINFFLRKAIENETKYKINLKNKKIENRYNILEQLYKKGDFDTVIKETESIISKDGDI